MATKKTAKRPTKRAAHRAATSTSIGKQVLAAIRKAGRQYIGSADLAHLTGMSTSWVAVTIKRLRDAGTPVESLRGIGGGYRIARA